MAGRLLARRQARRLAQDMSSRLPGRVCVALAKKLQAQFPSIRLEGNAFDDTPPTLIQLEWPADRLYPATGSYRTDVRLDCARWEGFGLAVRPDGTRWTFWSIHGYTKMSDLIGPGTLTIHPDGEVTNKRP
jgi:hypothetical protein